MPVSRLAARSATTGQSPTIAPAVVPEQIRLQRPELPDPEEVLAYYQLSRDAGYYSNGGPCARLLTERLEARLGGVHVIPIANCTMGIMAALRAACGQPHRERRVILTPAYTFTATACAIEWAGFEPVFVDVDGRGWHMDPSALEVALSRHCGTVAGVLACATFGTAPEIDIRRHWQALCADHGVPLLVDSAPGFGALDAHGRELGTLGDTEIFSFHATKPFAIGEGGIVTTPDPDIAAATARLINFGLGAGTRESVEVGLNAKMSELHAATALAMLDHFEGVLAGRRLIAARFIHALSGTGVRFQEGAPSSTWQLLTLSMPTPAARERLLTLAPAHRIEVRTMHDPALHRHPAFAACGRDALTVTDLLAERSVALPMANTMEPADIERIAVLVLTALSR